MRTCWRQDPRDYGERRTFEHKIEAYSCEIKNEVESQGSKGGRNEGEGDELGLNVTNDKKSNNSAVSRAFEWEECKTLYSYRFCGNYAID